MNKNQEELLNLKDIKENTEGTERSVDTYGLFIIGLLLLSIAFLGGIFYRVGLMIPSTPEIQIQGCIEGIGYDSNGIESVIINGQIYSGICGRQSEIHLFSIGDNVILKEEGDFGCDEYQLIKVANNECGDEK